MRSAGEIFLRKLLETCLALFALVFLSFLFIHLLPGGPFDEEVSFNPLVRESLRRLWALDQPFLNQFFHYSRGLLQGDLGHSMVHVDTSVSEILFRGFRQTVVLNLLATIVAFGFAFVSSGVKALYQSSFLGRVIEGLSVLGIALPSLFLGPVLIYFFGFYWNLLPTAFLTTPVHYILPVITIALRPWAQLHFILTQNLQETMSMDFIRTAKSKGLAPFRILQAHALKNSVLPLLAVSGPMIAGLISGSFLVEILFSIHGLGQQFADSLNERDYTVILGLVLVYGVVLIVLTNLFEAVAAWADPRVRERT